LADWNSRDLGAYPPSFFEKLVLKQLLEQWVHPSFISIKEFGNILRTNKNVQEELFLKIGIPIQILHGTTLLLKAFEGPS